MSPPPKRTTLTSRPSGPPLPGKKNVAPSINPNKQRTATSFDEMERRQQGEVKRLLFNGPATPSLGDGFRHINLDGTIELDSPERYFHRALEGGSQAYRFLLSLPNAGYPPGQGPLVPNNSPASDAEFEKGEQEEDEYKDDVTNEEKMKDLAFVADGKNVLKRRTKDTRINSIDVDKGKELLHLLQQKHHQPANHHNPAEKPKTKPKTEVNWFTSSRGKHFKVNLSPAHTAKEKGKEKQTTTEENDTTLVESDIDSDSEGGVSIPPQDQL